MDLTLKPARVVFPKPPFPWPFPWPWVQPKN
jgi:hypothetical protein